MTENTEKLKAWWNNEANEEPENCEHNWEIIDNIDNEDGSTTTIYFCTICSKCDEGKSFRR